MYRHKMHMNCQRISKEILVIKVLNDTMMFLTLGLKYWQVWDLYPDKTDFENPVLFTSCYPQRKEGKFNQCKGLKSQLIMILFYCTNIFSLNKIYWNHEVEITRKKSHSQVHHYMKCAFVSLSYIYPSIIHLPTQLPSYLPTYLPTYLSSHIYACVYIYVYLSI